MAASYSAAFYSAAFIEQALVNVYGLNGRTIRLVSKESNVGYDTLTYWIRKRSVAKDSSSSAAPKEKRPQEWRVEEQPLPCSRRIAHAWTKCTRGVGSEACSPIIRQAIDR